MCDWCNWQHIWLPPRRLRDRGPYRTPQALLFAALYAGAAVGFLLLYPMPQAWTIGVRRHVTLYPKYRDRGIRRLLHPIAAGKEDPWAEALWVSMQEDKASGL